MQDFIIRKIELKDLDQVMNIKNHFISSESIPWTETLVNKADMLIWWEEHTDPRWPIYVAEKTGFGVIGYSSLSQFRNKDGYKFTAESSIYLLNEYSGSGIARNLMLAAIEEGKSNGIRIITAWIDCDNLRSLAFHEKLGFYIVGTMKNVGFLNNKHKSVVILDLEL